MAAVEPSAFPSTKVHLARSARALLIRPRLHTRLEVQERLTLVVAPAGAGKTSLLESWARAGTPRPAGPARQDAPSAAEREPRVAWYALDADDREASRLVQGLAAAFECAVPGVGGSAGARAAGAASPLSCLMVLLRDLENALLPPPCAPRGDAPAHPADPPAPVCLVLDDYHTVAGARAAEEILGILLRHLPAEVRVIVAARALSPALLVQSGVLGQDTQIIAPDDLSFTADEAVELARLYGLSLSPAVRDAVLAGTGGWALGVALALRAQLDGGHVGGQFREVLAAHITSELLAHVPDELRQFLVESACLGWFAVREADAILERTDSQQQISAALHAGLFVQTAASATPLLSRAARVARAGGWETQAREPGGAVQTEPLYRYHDVLSATLTDLLQREDPARFRRIHERAATAREQSGAILRALDHVLALHDTELLSAAVSRFLPLIRQHGWWETLVRVMDHLPEEVRTPGQRGLLAFAQYVVGDDRAALETAERAYSWARAAGDRTEEYAALVLRANPLLRQHRVREVLAFCEPALARARAEGNQAAAGWLAEVCGGAFFLTGRSADGVALLEQIVVERRAAAATHEPAARERLARTLHTLAAYLVGDGSDTEAEPLLDEAAHLAVDLDARELLALTRLTRAVLLLRRAQNEAALHNAQAALQMGREQGMIEIWMTSLHVIALTRSRLGDTTGALAALDEQEDLARCLPSSTSLGACLAGRAHVLVCAQDYGGARTALDRAFALGVPPRELGSVLLEQGDLALCEGDALLAVRALGEACRLLDEGGLRPLQARALVLQAAALSRLGKHAQAARCFAEAGAQVEDRPWLAGLVADTMHAVEALVDVLSHWRLRGTARPLSEALRAARRPSRAEPQSGPPPATLAGAQGPLETPRLDAQASRWPSGQPGEHGRARVSRRRATEDDSTGARRGRVAPAPVLPATGYPAGRTPLRFSPFGDGYVGWDGWIRPLARLGNRKAREVLAFALWVNHPIARDEILDALWEGERTQHSVDAVHYALYQLRRVLGADVWCYTDSTYRLTCAVEDDLRTLLAAASQMEAAVAGAPPDLHTLLARAEQSLALYTGLYLPWCDSPWAEAPRAQGRAAALTLAQGLAEARWRTGQRASALAAVDAGLRIEPAHDGLQLLQAHVLVASGRRTEALERYRRYECFLEEEELGAPSPELQAFIAAVRDDTDTAVRQAGARLIRSRRHSER